MIFDKALSLSSAQPIHSCRAQNRNTRLSSHWLCGANALLSAAIEAGALAD
jgi:hypothetical protein